jgi:EmrB/QacA subfamily drug resistance transporter
VAGLKKGADGKTSHWLILILLAFAQFMVVLDVSIVNVALPAIQKAFHLTQTNLQWIVTAYSLTFGGFLIFGGRCADLFGRRRTFLTGVLVFTIASLGSGVSQSGAMLIVFRALQGLAAAFMSPAALSIVLVTYREGNERNVALSVWGAVASGGAAAGVLFGGILTQLLSWRWNFFVNIPIGAVVIVTALRILPLHESESDHSDLDLPGAVAITAGLMSLVYGLVQGPTHGWLDHRTTIWWGISAILLIFFVFNELRVEHPLVPFKIFKNRNLSSANSMMLFLTAALYSVFFFTTLYMNEILHYSYIRTGLSFLIIPIIIAIVATNVPKVIAKIGFKPILMVAPLFVAGGLFWLSHIPVNGNYWTDVAPGLALMGFGMGANFVSVTIAATSGVKREESGLASGLLNTSQQVGGSIGLAVLTGVSASAAIHFVTKHHAASATANKVAATVHGYHDGYLIAAAFGVIASLIATIFLRNVANAGGAEIVSAGH